ncbi:hypothetical protein, partial [Streptomyces sp. NPDC005969]|uniref:hypothetical protein n=1 Tax=Streptomyces sp. NPDC005969 TaxID=3156722 RepID=UPI0033C41F8E
MLLLMIWLVDVVWAYRKRFKINWPPGSGCCSHIWTSGSSVCGLVRLGVWQVSCGVLMALGCRAVHGAQACAAAPVTVF